MGAKRCSRAEGTRTEGKLGPWTPGLGSPLWAPWFVAMENHSLEKPLLLPRKDREGLGGRCAGRVSNIWMEKEKLLSRCVDGPDGCHLGPVTDDNSTLRAIPGLGLSGEG